MMRDNVLATLAYYDVLDFPLKAGENLKFLVAAPGPIAGGVTLSAVKAALDQLILDKSVDRDGEYFFLHGRDHIVPLRAKREKISEKKLARAAKAIRWLKFIPYVQAVFASGSLALGNCDELSDLDVLVVTKHGRIWLSRLLVSLGLSFMRIRRHSFEKIAPDKVCLNHYITDRSLRIPFESMYNAQTYINLRPILVRDPSVVERFEKENDWIAKFVAGQWHIRDDRLNELRVGKSRLTKIGDWLEKIAKRLQVKRILRNPLTASPLGHIVYSDKQLAFHPDSPENKVLGDYSLKLKELGLGGLDSHFSVN